MTEQSTRTMMDDITETIEGDGIRAIKIAIDRDMRHTLTVEYPSGYEDYRDAVEGMIEAVRLVVPSKTIDGQIIPVSRAHLRPFSHSITNPAFIMWVNEEYLYKMPLQRWNFTAVGTAIWCGRPDLNTQGILGNVLFTGDADRDGETTSLPSKAEEIIREAHQVTVDELMTDTTVQALKDIAGEEDLEHPFNDPTDPLGGISPESA